MSRNKVDQLSAANLQKVLWQTILNVRDKSVDPKEAQAIAAQSREICRISRLQLEAVKLASQGIKTNDNLLE